MLMRTRAGATQEAAHGDTSGWWPSKYGAGDQAGALNEITPGSSHEYELFEAARAMGMPPEASDDPGEQPP